MPTNQAEVPHSIGDFRRKCHVGAIALRVAAERLELLSRDPSRLHTADAGLAIDAMSCAARSCQALMAELLDADVERRTAFFDSEPEPSIL